MLWPAWHSSGGRTQLDVHRRHDDQMTQIQVTVTTMSSPPAGELVEIFYIDVEGANGSAVLRRHDVPAALKPGTRWLMDAASDGDSCTT
jgi:hypothetical protein